MSDNQTRDIGHFLRVKVGRNCVESNLNQIMTERNHSWDSEFKSVMLPVDVKKKKDKEDKSEDKNLPEDKYERVLRPAVFANQLETIVTRLISDRNIDPNKSVVQIGLDDGQQMLKIMLVVNDDETQSGDKRRRIFAAAYGCFRLKCLLRIFPRLWRMFLSVSLNL